ncbi:DNA alkylation repair protein [Melioribacter sp. OK-6-Me]|uniref:DNA alkylation repair protein n=1 Tax=unclassified Melioribacter TaxID=2627329 RepID=UPI003ED94D9C
MKEIGWTKEKVMHLLLSKRNEKNKTGMARYGINVEKAFGVSLNELRDIARRIGKNHELAKELWESGYHEARHLAVLIEELDKVTKKQMEKWVHDFDSWDLCDGTCIHLFRKTPFANDKINRWMKNDEEFVRRASFTLIATLALHDKKADDVTFINYLSDIKRYSYDERNFVKKAVNWALRQIGKRNINLNRLAVQIAQELKNSNTKSARWIGSDAYRELTKPETIRNLK